MRYWFPRFGSAVVVSAAASAATFAGSVLVLRILAANEAGRWVLVTSLAALVGALGVLGQPQLISRVYSRSSQPHHWQADLVNTLLINSPLILLGSVGVALFYKLTPFEGLFILVSALDDTVTQTAAFMLHARRSYVWATLLLRLANALFLLPVGLAALGLIRVGVTGFLSFQLVLDMLCAAIGLISLKLQMPAGSARISLAERRGALDMAALIITNMFLDPGLLAVAGYLVPAELIAAFGGLFTLLRPFFLFQSVLLQTLSVEIVRNPDLPRKKMTRAIWAAAVPLAALAWALMPPLLDRLYAGKFNVVAAAALPMSLIGVLVLTEALPRSQVTGRADSAMLRRYGAAQIPIALGAIVVEIILINRLGIVGAAWAGCGLMIARNLAALLFARLSNAQESSSS